MIGEDARTPAGGWYAYGVTGAATLPSWAVEVALTVERPVDRHAAWFASGNDQIPAGPPALQWEAQAMVLLRAPGRGSWLAGIAEAAAEVEAVAGLRSVSGSDGSQGSWSGARSRLLLGPPLSGLVPVPAAVPQVRLEAPPGSGGSLGQYGAGAPPREAGTCRGGRAREPS